MNKRKNLGGVKIGNKPILGNETKIVKTDEGAKDGQNKCPQCGSNRYSRKCKNRKIKM